MSTPVCQLCKARPCPDHATVCRQCTRVLEQDLGRVADLGDALEDALARRDRIDRPLGLRRSDAVDESGPETLRVQPLPVNLDAGDELRALRRVLDGWARWQAERRGLHRPVDTLRALARFLGDARSVEWLRRQVEGPRLAQEVGAAVQRAARLVDRPPPTWYAGPCGGLRVDDDGLLSECDADVYLRSGEVTYECRACGGVLDVAERQAWLQRQAEDQLVHAALAAQAVTVLGEHLTSAQIRGYAHRGRLMAKGRDVAGRPLYRLGDVIDLATEDAGRPSRARDTPPGRRGA